MIGFTDRWAIPWLVFLADWSIRWGVVLAILAVWFVLALSSITPRCCQSTQRRSGARALSFCLADHVVRSSTPDRDALRRLAFKTAPLVSIARDPIQAICCDPGSSPSFR